MNLKKASIFAINYDIYLVLCSTNKQIKYKLSCVT